MPLSLFTPLVRDWFAGKFGEPTPPQRLGWPAIQSGAHTLIAAPTGAGKTFAAFLWAVDALLREGEALPNAARVLYLSPLKALSNDVRKNLRVPLDELRALDPSLPEIRVLVRTGDTPAAERAAMTRRAPHILATTPESLYILLTSENGRAMLRGVRTVIVDEIHAMLGDKRGAHLALSLERLETLALQSGNSAPQRIALSATQKPLSAVGQFLVGPDRECALIDAGTLRTMDLDIEIPASPLEAVCSHETWSEIYARMAELIEAHRTTLLFVNTRKLAERVSAQLIRLLGPQAVACHHGSLSRERRLDAEQRLKAGELRALVATASLELGIDIGEADLVIQCGATRSIAALLQRVGRSGHGPGRVPKGRIFPLTQDELIEAAALLRAIGQGTLDVTPQPRKPLDILAQQIVAACVPEAWNEAELFDLVRSAWPYRDLTREEFDAAVALHTDGRRALLHRDGVQGRLLATRRARMTAITSGGAIPDNADYRVIAQPDETFIGTLNEDFAVESNAGDIFQLGNASWRVLKLEPGVMRVADAQGAPPSVPFWLGEAPSRTAELSEAVSQIREAALDPNAPGGPLALAPHLVQPIAEFMEEGRKTLGAVPTRRRLILERFFDETGGMQLILHAPLGNRINRAWGLALRKRFCRRFGFELQAAANEEAILLSLGPHSSFPLEEVFGYLSSRSAIDVLTQALLDSPLFATRWRWNVSRALLVPRMYGGKRLPAPLARMRAEDLLVQAFPQVLACPENLPGGDLPVPMDHPLVRQTIDDCLHEAMDADGLLEVLRSIESGAIETLAVDTPAPSAFARGILNANLYSFLDDAPLEERRTQAVASRRHGGDRAADHMGALDPAAVARVREEAWPQPRDAEELHEALLWMGYLTREEAAPWEELIEELRAMDRVQWERGEWEGERCFAAEAPRDPLRALRGRMDALGPVFSDEPLMLTLETEGHVLRTRLDGREAWCDRRLLARIHRYTLETLRREIAPVTAAQFMHFLACWQHVDPAHKLEGPAGLRAALEQLAGYEAPAAAWENTILPARVKDYRREWLDQLTLGGEFAWGRLWGAGNAAPRSAPLAFVKREDLETWFALAPPLEFEEMGREARRVLAALAGRGAMFQAELMRASGLLPEHFEAGLGELIARGALSCDSYGGLRQLLRPPHKRKAPIAAPERWAHFREATMIALDSENSHDPVPGSANPAYLNPALEDERRAEFIARNLLKRYGVVFKRMLARERQPIPWRDLFRVLRRMELAGEVRGGRFVGGFSGEQFALPEAVALLRKLRRENRAPVDASATPEMPGLRVSAADPLNLVGILTPESRIAPTTLQMIEIGR